MTASAHHGGPRRVRRIVVLGDSITELGAEPGGYVWLIERWLAALI